MSISPPRPFRRPFRLSTIATLTALVLATLWIVPRPAESQRRTVTVYRDADFRSTSMAVIRDLRDLRRTPIGNDSISSIRVPRGCEAELFADIDYGGRSMLVTDDIYDMNGTRVGNDEVSSIRVDCRGGRRPGRPSGRPPGGRDVELFADIDYGGVSEIARGDVRDMRRTGIGNDELSSLLVPRGCEVELFADIDYGGRSFVARGDIPDLRRTPIGNDAVSSLVVDCRGGGGGGRSDEVTVYRDADFRGTSESFRRDLPDLRGSRIGNDEMTSIRVPRGCEAELFEHSNYQGRSILVRDEDIRDLGRTRVGNDTVSSMRVYCR